MIHARRKYPAFGLGTFTDLGGSNPSVLGYVREHEDDIVLCVHNLSRFPQPVELDLPLGGVEPIELLGGVRSRRSASCRTSDVLGAYGFYWFRLPKPVQTLDEDPPVTAAADAAVLGALADYIATARWFGGKGRCRCRRPTSAAWPGSTRPRRRGCSRRPPLRTSPAPAEQRVESPRVRIELATLEYDDGTTELYQLPGLLPLPAGAARARPGRAVDRRGLRRGVRLRRPA